jgi:D-alanyl-D-alanine carboxypeptidase
MALLSAPVIDSRGVYAASPPILGNDGSLAHTATTPPARGHAGAKPGTTTVPGADGETLEPKGQNTAGYVTTRSGRRLAHALMVDDVGAIENIASDVADVVQEETEIADPIYEGVR